MIYIAVATVYAMVLALAYYIFPEPKKMEFCKSNRFAVIVPAHNEELLIPKLCESLSQLDYSSSFYKVFIIADNCTDHTPEVCTQYSCEVLIRNDEMKRGKGYAIDWALNQIPLDDYDAILIIDADNYVDCKLLDELNILLNNGERAIQCCNSVGNRNDSWFTQLLFVSRTINNLLYHHSKYKLGLSSYLMGNGICFATELINKKGWTAFSAGEDWEYYAQLVEDNIKIGFAAKARVFHQESRSLNQATSQRLRWSSGRFSIAKTLGLRLFLKGIRERNWQKIDASFPLIFPNYSLQINLTLVTLALAFLLPSSAMKVFFVSAALVLLAGQFLLFLAGAFIAGSPWKIFCAALYAPVFLIWKSVIDILCLTGLYRGKKWVRTRRHQS